MAQVATKAMAWGSSRDVKEKMRKRVLSSGIPISVRGGEVPSLFNALKLLEVFGESAVLSAVRQAMADDLAKRLREAAAMGHLEVLPVHYPCSAGPADGCLREVFSYDSEILHEFVP